MRTLIDLDVACRKCGETTQLKATTEQLTELYLPRGERRLIQEIFPDLSIGDRELLISGTCDTCWQKMFGSDEDEEE
jgi:hypothetical protein